MKKTQKIFLAAIILIISIAILAFSIIYRRCPTEAYDSNKYLKIALNENLGENIYSIQNNYNLNVYSNTYRTAIDEAYSLIENNKFSFDNPLIVYNLYGTNSLSCNINFSTLRKSYLKYTISVDNDTIPDYSNILKNDGKNDLTRKHNYQIIGFVPGYKNQLKLELINSSNKTISSKIIDIDLTNISTNSEAVLSFENGTSTISMANGLFTVLGNDSDAQDYVALYDNNGVIRSELPINEHRANQILFKDNLMYYSISYQNIVAVNNLGKVIENYDIGIDYKLHHDYVFDEDGNILVLVDNQKKSTVEDCIIKVDLKTKKVTEVLDLENIFKSYMDTCKKPATEDSLDWIHINSIEHVDGDIIISARETSSIIKIKDINTNPTLEYILASEELWEDTDFSDFVYKKVGNFKIHAGQHSVRYKASDVEHEYFLIFYDNNWGKQNTQPDFNYNSIGITNTGTMRKGDKSNYYVYKVNEKEKTFELVDSFSVEFSGIVSSAQTIGNNNIVINSGVPGIFAEYDENHNLIRKFKIKPNNIFVYRVYKFDFNNFWFKSN